MSGTIRKSDSGATAAAGTYGEQRLSTKIYHTVNCGLYFWRDGCGILFDGLHGCGPYQCFSPLPGSIRHQMLHGQGLFAHLNGALFSHAHGDHCDPDALYFVQHTAAPLPCFLYGGAGNTISCRPAAAGVLCMEVGSFTVYAIGAAHNGVDEKRKELFQLPTCVFLLESGGERFLLGGDGCLDGVSKLGGLCRQVDLAFLNPFHLNGAENISLLRAIQPQRIAIYHLPFPEDDVYLSRSMASQLIRRPPEGIPAPFFMPHMAWFEEDSPPWAGRE